MSWLESLKVGDKVGVRVSHLGSIGIEYFIGVVVKVLKTKVEVSYLGHTSTFTLPAGSTRRGKWDIPDQLVELTPEIMTLVTHRRLATALEKRLSAIKVREFSIEQLQSLNSFLDSLKPAPKDESNQ
jgi:hypothetical protein